jgi:hypothetical protein
MLGRESMARITDIAIMASEGTITRSHVHGVEPTFRSKLWASTDDDSSTGSEEDKATTPELVAEAIEAGFTVDQIRQAEAELESPSTPKVCSKLKDGSISKQIVEVWINNRRNQGKPWTGPLPPPQKSPLRTLGDALANAKVENRRKVANTRVMNVSHRGSVLLESSSVQRRHTLSQMMNEARTTPRLVHMATGAELKGADTGDCGMPAISSAQEQRPTSPTVTMATIAQPSGHATAQGNSNSKSSKMGEISGGLIEIDSPVQEGCHAPRMGQTGSQHSPLWDIDLPQVWSGCSPKQAQRSTTLN